MDEIFGSVRAAVLPGPPGQILGSLAPQLFKNRRLLDAFHAHALLNTATKPELAGVQSARNLLILEQANELASLDVPDSGLPDRVPLIDGFAASLPSASLNRKERRRKRAHLVEKALELHELGLKQEIDRQRGLLTDEATPALPGKRKRKSRRSAMPLHDMLENTSRDELLQDLESIKRDMLNVDVKRDVINGQIVDIESKISTLEGIRQQMKSSLLDLRQEELELDDELQGVQHLLAIKGETAPGVRAPLNRLASETSRRRKGPAFLPSEHDDLPAGVAFMTLSGHSGSITAVDFTEPYGMGVTASTDETLRLWDLSVGVEIGELGSHRGIVKCLQVENATAITGGSDGKLKMWDLEKAEQAFVQGPTSQKDVFSSDDAATFGADALDDPCIFTLDGHTKAVTSLYFDRSTLVTGSSDRTLRQWDLETRQCLLTMDILWAISNPLTSQSLSAAADDATSPSASPLRHVLNRRLSMLESPTTTTYADGSWEMYEDFVGGLQFWGYALASGTGDGCVRMWDMRTGQAHRTLVGHTAPVTSVQFDETHLVSGSLDRSIRIWDLRMGTISDTIRYDHPVTALSFDTRKIVAAAGDNSVRLFNRTTLQNTSLNINGHTSPVERLALADKYLMTGARDSTVKIWSLP